MPNRHAAPSTPERSAAILAEALRRIDRAIPDPVDLDALRQALETELAKGSMSLVGLMKVGRRRALDRIRRLANKEAATRAGHRVFTFAVDSEQTLTRSADDLTL